MAPGRLEPFKPFWPAPTPPKFSRPALKSSSLSLSVEMTSAPTSTCAPLPKATPLGLMRKTCPLDCRLPRIWLGLPPSTRLSTWLELLGWTKRVVSSAPMLNCCQLMTAPLLLVTVRVLPLVVNVAAPCTTCAPCGLASRPAGVPMAARAAARRCRRREVALGSPSLTREACKRSSRCKRRCSARCCWREATGRPRRAASSTSSKRWGRAGRVMVGLGRRLSRRGSG